MSSTKESQAIENKEPAKFNYNSVDYLEPRFPRLVNKKGLNILRAICSVLLFIIWILVFVWIHPIAQIVFMTMWGNSAALITSILSLYISLKGTDNASSKIKKLNNLLLEYVFSMEMVITIVFWTVLYDWVIAIIKAEGNERTIPLQIAIHSVPLFAVCCNVILSNVRFNPGNWKVTCVASIIFMFANYGGKQLVGQPLYPFLPWDGSFRAYLNAVILVLVATVLNYLCSKFIVNKLPLMSAKHAKESLLESQLN
ncbi:hypothetical protein FGO68_gene9156 [Halteria grandinella]|uniref:Transmembrane protein n=1 Tax=Halteria grandinella TaxID=5974 RepID=A0A8J8NLE0_HALGN|nr:hypothetical protein FGO68_gene9156 [Halteria grandinella]